MSTTTNGRRRRTSAPAPKITLAVDDRTDNLSDEALICRSWGHSWVLKPMSNARFLELLDRGLTEKHRICGCGSEWIILFDVHSFDPVQTIRRYPKNSDETQYLLTPGSGRLHRNEARKAEFAREHADLVQAV